MGYTVSAVSHPPRSANDNRPSYAPAYSRPLRFQGLGDGDPGIVQTLAAMRAAMVDATRDPLVIDTARQIVAASGSQAGHDVRRSMDALFRWLASRYRFVRDPLDVEWLTVPRAMLDDIAARGSVAEDCESAATLLASLAEAVGIPTRFRVVGQPGSADYSHVYLEAFTGRAWTPYDLTGRPPRPGVAPPGLMGRRAIFAADDTLTEDDMLYRTGLRGLGQDYESDMTLYAPSSYDPGPSYDPALISEPVGDVYGPPSPPREWLDTRAPVSGDSNTSPIDWSNIFKGTGELLSGVAKAAGAALPILERYGVVTPEAGHPFRLPYPGEPGYAYAASGGYLPYTRAGIGPLSMPSLGGWGTWLAVGGLGLVVMAAMSRRRRR
jgi:hypothetical protein